MTATSAGADATPVSAPKVSGKPAGSGASSFALNFTGTSSVFQQVKQTQASLARLSRFQQQQSQTNPSSQSKSNQSGSSSLTTATTSESSSVGISQQAKSTSFVDCLIRRFKNCFSEDFCTVPMFVVGNLSPGSDGTHLILPPCVSLGGQNIGRFASPRNVKLMNSIRESCKSIEELDLGGNKLNDLIEVYKILQCTPNLKFLNLSENDLSRSSPVAMATAASTCCTPTYGSNLTSLSTSQAQSSGNYSASSMTLSAPANRTCLAPITQNHNQPTIGSRRHSTLGQASSGPSELNGSARLSMRARDARRSAVTAAVAQSKKTSSLVASKLTNSATAAVAQSNHHRNKLASGRLGGGGTSDLKGNFIGGGQRHQTPTTSTMNLVRSLSSLSAKDVRLTTSSSLSRISAHQRASAGEFSQPTSGTSRSNSVSSSLTVTTNSTAGSMKKNLIKVASKPISTPKGKLETVAGSQTKLFVEPIAEIDNDVDMNEQHGYPPPLMTSQQQQSTIVNGSQLNQSTRITGTNKATTLTTTITTGSHHTNYRRTFNSIKALALNNTGCQWRVVCSILSRMPNLEELHLSLNNYERIDLDPNEFKYPSLKRLYLCNNPKLTNWQELNKLLLAFPSLEALSIADCNISQIPDNLDRAREWCKLSGLNINGWPIKEWPVVERLNQLPSLVDLKCRNLEVLNSIDEPRSHLIARLPKLQRLNGSEIEEREHAEKAFLRFFMANSHLERPSRFHELVQIHGEVITVDVDVDLSPPSHAQVRVVYLNRNYYKKENEDEIIMSEDFLNKLMDTVDPISGTNNVVQQQAGNLDNRMDVNEFAAGSAGGELELVEGHSKYIRLFKNEGQEVLSIEIDLRQSVRKFKSTLAHLFGLESRNLILYYIDHEMVGLMGPELIKHNQKKLWNYNVQDGDQFIVEER